MMKTPLMRSCGAAVWLITALGCIHLGLMAMGYNPIETLGLQNMAKVIGYIFGIAGVASLIMFFMGGCCGGHCSCGVSH
jgi:hypothetical protein